MGGEGGEGVVAKFISCNVRTAGKLFTNKKRAKVYFLWPRTRLELELVHKLKLEMKPKLAWN